MNSLLLNSAGMKSRIKEPLSDEPAIPVIPFLQAAEDDAGNIQSITNNIDQQRAETEQLATAIQ